MFVNSVIENIPTFRLLYKLYAKFVKKYKLQKNVSIAIPETYFLKN
ncbi:hypothetical protein LEP1GSC127_4194 [Leptospira kirschneri str. 200801925]|nr:hypothetical protein LEP1GSC127_4194 [Leptospira kirschneri str. 200801925]